MNFHPFFRVSKLHSVQTVSMADLRKTRSFACLRRRCQQLRRLSQTIAHPPAEDAEKFSYLAEDSVQS